MERPRKGGLSQKTTLMSDRTTIAINLFGKGFNCAQSVLCAFAGDLDLEEIDALRVAGMFGGGMGHMGKVCGAVTGAFMVLGLLYSRTKEGEDARKLEGYSLVQEFSKRFAAIHGMIDCRALIGIDISTPEGLAEAKAKKVFETCCAAYVKDAVQILEDIIPHPDKI